MNEYYLGVDIGAVSVKIALLTRQDSLHSLIPHAAYVEPITLGERSYFLFLSKYKRIQGEPIRACFELLAEITPALPSDGQLKVVVTGSGGNLVADLLQTPYINEFIAVANGVGTLHPETRTILEIGGDSSKYIRIEVDPETLAVGIEDYERNGECAAGTGSFIDQQAKRLLFAVEDVGDIVLGADRSAAIAGRCSVFAKSDMIHSQQKGFQPPEILKGLCEAVVRNFKGSITKSKELIPPVAFIGGVAANKGIVQAIQNIFQFGEGKWSVPVYFMWMEAIGCALQAESLEQRASVQHIAQLISHEADVRKSITTSVPISLNKVTLLRDRVHDYALPACQKTMSYLGIDIGSVTTKLVLIDEAGGLIKEIYTRTDGRPIEVVCKNLKRIGEEIGDRVEIRGVGTTGSGRELIGELIGADTIRDEITAHKTGAMHISERLTGKKVDTIFDIGGQDAKYIAIENGVVVDFAMNEACAAGTGSFLEEQAERLGIRIKNEFSGLALSSRHPVRLGERCTVFMEKDIIPYLQRGTPREDIIAGLAFSIVYNYLNRVVRGRRIGDTIYFQGGTAYNDAVAGAFATVLNKEIIVPPYNGVIGAIGAALLAKEKMESTNHRTSFRGFQLDQVKYRLRSFTCKGCSNFCDIQEFDVEGQKTYWGNKCSERFRKSIVRDKEPVIEDLFRYRNELLRRGHDAPDSSGTIRIGYPRTMYFFDQFTFWSTYFRELGVQLILSEETNQQIIHSGVESTVAEPCFPIAVAHGHIQNLIDRGADYIFQPNVINTETNFPKTNSFLCPWGQTLCFVIKHTPAFAAHRDKILHPNIRFSEGRRQVKSAMKEVAEIIGSSKTRSDRAVELAYAAQRDFKRSLLEKGRSALEHICTMKGKAVVLIGRPYNIYDPMINLNIPQKLRDYYGINVIPFDFLSADDVDITDVTENMFWNYGRRILQVSKMIRDYPNLHLIYITNFKCGPDSYIKHYIRDASHSPFLVLQFDGHGNDAGMITRCEAYLDSKGFLT